MKNMPPEALEEVAGYFQVLAEPTRLRILNILREGERNVGDLAQMCGYTAANVSRHLSLMTKNGLVTREGRGTSACITVLQTNPCMRCATWCATTLPARSRARKPAGPVFQCPLIWSSGCPGSHCPIAASFLQNRVGPLLWQGR